jgi:hypothetical protein
VKTGEPACGTAHAVLGAEPVGDPVQLRSAAVPVEHEPLSGEPPEWFGDPEVTGAERAVVEQSEVLVQELCPSGRREDLADHRHRLLAVQAADLIAHDGATT